MADPVEVNPNAKEPAWRISATYPRTSPSQIKTYIECHRKWWYENVRKLRKPPTKSQAKGTALHAISEHFLVTGEVPTLARVLELIAESAREEDKDQPVVFEVDEDTLKHLVWLLTNSFEFYRQIRERYTSLQIEGEFKDEHSFSVWNKGFSDFVAWSHIENELVIGKGAKAFRHKIDKNEMLVGDHKSTSDWKYVKSEEELMFDPQAISYCQHFLRELEAQGKRVDHIKFLHHYILTADRAKPPEPRFTVIEMTREQLAEGVALIAATVRDMEADYQKDELDVPRNATPDPITGKRACDNYGGCPHSDYCQEKDMDAFMRSLLEGVHGAPAPEPAKPQVDYDESPAPSPIGPQPSAPVETPTGGDAADDVQAGGLGMSPEPVSKRYRCFPEPGVKLILIDTWGVKPRIQGTTLEEFLNPIATQWAKSQNIAHHSLERFNNGARAIVHLGLTPPLPNVLEVDTRTRFGGEFLSYVAEYAARNPDHLIFRGGSGR